ncbi:hypothetical protein [Ideonella alba]|uniref:Uncharacterized protein n=1 Tax=Ideonella alba TaxID=2824118 RepID=A0A940Y8U7_9BURK|nr:hypothetical protein [Ideonella alba]MBQ0932154.1 hypothetical protein [Ideonella alba]
MRLLTRRLFTALLAAVPLWAAATPIDLAYNPSNTGPAYAWRLDAVRVSADGRKLQVRTQPSGSLPGGMINLGSYPWWITLVAYDQGAGRTGNGDRWRGNAALPAPTGRWATVATLALGSGTVYRVRPIATGGIVRGLPGVTWSGTVQGTLTTDGTRGPLDASHLVDFDLHIVGDQH